MPTFSSLVMFAALFFPLLLSLVQLPARNSPPSASPAPGAAATFRQDRVYSLVRLNGKVVPAEVEFASTAGSRHWVKMDEAVLRLRRDGTFTASAKFYRELLQSGRRAPGAASRRLLNDGAHGRYVLRGDSVELKVARRRDSPSGTAYGRISGDRLRIRHTLRDGNLRHNVDVELRIDPSIW